MIRKPYVVVFAFVLVIGLLLFSFFRNKAEPTEKTNQDTETERSEEPASVEPDPMPSVNDLPQPAFDSIAEAEKFKEDTMNEVDPQLAAYLAAFETPIEYYGHVLDEEGIPVVGAKIKFIAINNPKQPLNPETHYERLSDADGDFSITGITGTRLIVRIEKEGYRMLPNPASSLGYHPSATRKDDGEIPSENEPAIFVMEKLNAPAPLIKRRLTQKLPLNGQVLPIDLPSGKVRSGSPFTVSLQSDYDPETHEVNNWEVIIKIENGGLIEHADYANFEAPESGYTNEVTFRVTEDMERMPNSFRQDYYFVVDDGQQYGRGTLYVSSSGAFNFSYYLNPEGSRNLEYDRALDVTNQY